MKSVLLLSAVSAAYGFLAPLSNHGMARTSVTRMSVATGESTRPLKVIIAGGGIGGLVLGNALQRYGIDFAIYEKTKEYKPFGGPIQVQSNALAALEAINKDMCEEIMAAGTTTGNRVNGLKDGKTNKWYCQFDTGAPAQKRGLPLTRVVDRPDLQSVLLKYLNLENLHNGNEIVDYQEDADGVTVRLSNGESVKGDVLVGADGIWSIIRGRLHEEPAGKESAFYSGYTCFTGVCLLRPEDVAEVAYKVYLNEGQYFVCSDVGKGRMQWYAMLGQEPGIKLEGSPREHLLKAYKGWSPEVVTLLEATGDADITQRDLYDRAPALFKGWSKGRVTILGDAAHPMMPNLGQGGCQAVEDGYRLAQELSRVRQPSDVSYALSTYSNYRIVRSSAVHGLARIASDVLFFSGVLFSNPLIGSVVGFLMNLSMPYILEFLYQNPLDEVDWQHTKGRLTDMASYEETESKYRSVKEAMEALQKREDARRRQLADA